MSSLPPVQKIFQDIRKSWDFSLKHWFFGTDNKLVDRIACYTFLPQQWYTSTASFNLLFIDMCLLVWRHEILLLHSTWHVRLTKLFSSKSNHRVLEDVHIITTNSEKAGNTYKMMSDICMAFFWVDPYFNRAIWSGDEWVRIYAAAYKYSNKYSKTVYKNHF